MSPVQGKSPPVQVKEPYGNIDMVTCRISSCNPECTTADNTRKRIWQYIKKEKKYHKWLNTGAFALLFCFHPATRNVQGTPDDNAHEVDRQYIEK